MKRLYVTALKSVGLVAAGDDPEATVTFWKSVDAPTERPEKSKMTPTEKSAESAPTVHEVNMDLSAIEDQDFRKSVEDHIADLESQIAEFEKEPEDPVEKADPEVQALLKAQDTKIAELESDVAKERAERRTTEYIGKAEPLQALLGKAEEVGPVLADLADKAPESFGKLFSSLEAAAQREGMAKLFSELGAGEGEGETDPVSKRDAWVEKNRKDTESDAQARARFWSENPTVVEEARS